ncbi:phosphatidylglycerophosphate phosphatase PTPMT2 [Magnolia sinica]|uniref:phosphatidylglycerophosphate phosphatase PTPMT2 n=1 Tax=Magnolia sinica TaxID=86752 RepID=UPI0026586476|nr:phosphatidylglycerophosphate phosphatase PTPMT2 [Magnolia sinica]XP_058085006.1 phosphatidylglycerophosphate phosphatase PTPMT2 [Magnolia sinica]XP_058085007.1 phosphatidylglycerophosphate phosphatase PTPMT2 [Magnolia sinica]XP_058085008.1 phosphatidylglycerophosphate phosphatase PTPMT2 [Magnolia sinica]
MYIEELTERESGIGDEESLTDVGSTEVVLLNAKRALIVVGGRILFYPTLLYNVVRNKIESEFRWWDFVDEHLLLGAVPFPTDVPRLKQLGVEGVITLNEPYETLVPTSLYLAHGIDHLVIPTRDYLFAPSFGDICQAVGFIHRNASHGRTTYVHCKAGRGRSTTIVLCYLVQHKGMTPAAAYEYVRFSRPRVRLAAAQWQAVQEYYEVKVTKTRKGSFMDNPIMKSPALMTAQGTMVFDDGSVVMVAKTDLDGYNGSHESGIVGNDIWAELSLVYRVQFAGQAALARLSCLWLRCHTGQKIGAEKLGKESCSVEADQRGGLGVDIPVY